MKIHEIPGLVSSCFLIEDDGLFLIDAGFLGFERKILRKIRQIGRKPQDIQLIILSHGHLDHFGGLGAIRSASGASVACHKSEYKSLSSASKEISPSITVAAHVLTFLAQVSMPFIKTEAVTPDIVLENGMLLEDFGLGGKVLHTPGHTSGSISILMEDGSTFIGDLVMGKVPLKYKPMAPSFAEDMASVRNSWKYLLESGAETIYPAHGHPFVASELEELIATTPID